jgi:hypothetical protein
MSLSFADFAWILLALTAAIAAGACFFSKNRVEPVGVVRSNDFTDERLRQAAIHAVKGVDVSKMGAEEAEAHLEELARHGVAKEYAEIEEANHSSEMVHTIAPESNKKEWVHDPLFF